METVAQPQVPHSWQTAHGPLPWQTPMRLKMPGKKCPRTMPLGTSPDATQDDSHSTRPSFHEHQALASTKLGWGHT